VLCALASARSQTLFSDVAAQVGITQLHEKGDACAPGTASGSAWADYDNDGDVDLFLTNDGGPNLLYRNEGDTDNDGLPNFVDVASQAGVALLDRSSHSAVFIDIDNDGDQDLFVTRWGGNNLFRNDLIESGTATFADVTASCGIVSASRAVTTAWGDYDGDGDLDLYLPNYRYCPGNDQSMDFLYRNNGDGTFTDVTSLLCPNGVGNCPQLNGLAFSAGWVDYDNDADLDLYVVNDYITTHRWPNVLWRNDGSDGAGEWIFTDVSAASGAGVAINSMGLGVGDYDNDGWLDFAISNKGPNVLLRNTGLGTFQSVAASAGVDRPLTPEGKTAITWGTVFFDYDNDQWQDLYIVAGEIGGQANAQPNAFFQNNADGTFDDISAISGLDDPLRGRAASIADFDNDGFVDVFVGNLNRPDLGTTSPFFLFHNKAAELGTTNHWLTVTVEGTVSNNDGIGTRLNLTTPDGLTQVREITTGPTYGGGDYRAGFFGLGQHTSGELIVRWPNGVIQNIGTVLADEKIHLIEPTGSTAPMVSNIPDQIVNVGTSFATISLDDYVYDSDHADNQIIWTASGNSALIVTIDANRVATVTVPTPSWVGSETITFTAIDPLGFSDSDEATFTVQPPPAVTFRINCGGSNYMDGSGKLFVADKAYVPGDFGYIGGNVKTYTNDILGTTDDPLYQTLRYLNGTVIYQLDNMPAGGYEVTLYFMEPSIPEVGGRLFDILAEGTVALDNYDIFANAGASFTAVTETFTTQVSDGQLNLDFVSANNRAIIICAIEVSSLPYGWSAPVVSDIPDQTIEAGDSFSTISLDLYVSDPDHGDTEINWTVSGNNALTVTVDSNRVATITTPGSYWNGSETIIFTATDPDGFSDSDTTIITVTPPPPISVRINCGGVDFTDGNGNLFVADKEYTAGDFGSIGGTSKIYPQGIEGTTDDPLYQAIRYLNGTFSYKFDNIPLGTYEITLYFIEPSINGIGGRLFDVTVEGSVLLDNYDIFANAGGLFTAATETLFTPVSDGQLTIEFSSVNNKNAITCAIAVVQIPSLSLTKPEGTHQENPALMSALPREFELAANYPNPFNPQTVIRYALQHDGRVSLKVYNTLGQEVAVLVDEYQTAGYKSVIWNASTDRGSPVASGVYLYRLTAGNFTAARKMILSR
jgi:hypothetical protein